MYSKLICDNMYAQYLRYGGVGAGSFDEEPGYSWARSGKRVCNGVSGGSFQPAGAEQAVARITDMVRLWQVNALWQIGPELAPPNLIDLATDRGWATTPGTIGMAIQLDEPVPDVVLPDGLEIVRAGDDESLRTWARIYFSPHSPDYQEAFADIVCELGCGDDLPWTYYIGYLGGTPVASSMIFVGGGAAGLYYIGTVPEFRRRGIGTAMTRFTLKQAQEMGHDVVVLQATAMGAPLYRRVGFEDYCKITVLVWRAQQP